MSHTLLEFASDQVGAADLTEGERHGLLTSERRRLALEILDGKSAPVDLVDLAAAIAEQEADSDAADPRTVERVQISLHHAHLPKLDESGVIDYDPDSNQLRPSRSG